MMTQSQEKVINQKALKRKDLSGCWV